jgi:hypothetical protein
MSRSGRRRRRSGRRPRGSVGGGLRSIRPKRAQLEAQLAPGVTLADGCLSVTARPAFTEGLDRWLATVETPIDDRVFTDLLEPRDRSWMRVYLLADS